MWNKSEADMMFIKMDFLKFPVVPQFLMWSDQNSKERIRSCT
jgi:hypothetical protein